MVWCMVYHIHGKIPLQREREQTVLYHKNVALATFTSKEMGNLSFYLFLFSDFLQWTCITFSRKEKKVN